MLYWGDSTPLPGWQWWIQTSTSAQRSESLISFLTGIASEDASWRVRTHTSAQHQWGHQCGSITEGCMRSSNVVHVLSLVELYQQSSRPPVREGGISREPELPPLPTSNEAERNPRELTTMLFLGFQDPWTVCLLLSTFQSLLIFIFYIISRGFSCI